jgi:succinate-semialdehyde dehydrogenase/glutarate-semialdehyde dehydrogenase
LECTSKHLPFREEIFGPVFSIFKVKNEEEAISLSNESEYGLGACIVSNDLDYAEELAK